MVWTCGLCSADDVSLRIPAARWTEPLPGDNMLPLELAQELARGRISTGLRPGDWLISDRPPLQAALFLVTPGYLISGATASSYQPAAVALQLLSIVGVWILVRALGGGTGLSAFAAVTAFLTPMTIVNAAFVWPKLLGAAFLFPVAAIHFAPCCRELRSDWRWGAVLGALSALALLSHGTLAFSVVGMAIAALITWNFGRPKYVASAAVAMVALYLPWSAYQSFVDPPGNRLLKWHLADVVPVDSRSTLQTLRDSYSSLTWQDYLAKKAEGARMLGWAPLPFVYEGTVGTIVSLWRGDEMQAQTELRKVRLFQSLYVMAGSGPLFLFAPILLLVRRTWNVALAVMLSFAVWWLLVLSPVSLALRTGSMFNELALLAIIAVALWRVAPAAAWTLMALHCLTTAFQYYF